jgi:hypothetical protein
LLLVVKAKTVKLGTHISRVRTSKIMEMHEQTYKYKENDIVKNQLNDQAKEFLQSFIFFFFYNFNVFYVYYVYLFYLFIA